MLFYKAIVIVTAMRKKGGQFLRRRNQGWHRRTGDYKKWRHWSFYTTNNTPWTAGTDLDSTAGLKVKLMLYSV